METLRNEWNKQRLFLKHKFLYPGTGAQNQNYELEKQISEEEYEHTWAIFQEIVKTNFYENVKYKRSQQSRGQRRILSPIA
jgi:hypothetical protein